MIVIFTIMLLLLLVLSLSSILCYIHQFSLLLLPPNFYLLIFSSNLCSNFLIISNLIYILSLFFSKLYIYHQFFDFSLFFVYHFFPVTFWLSQLTTTAWGEFKTMNSSSIVYPYLSTLIGKPFLVCIFLFCSLSIIKAYCRESFELHLATTSIDTCLM